MTTTTSKSSLTRTTEGWDLHLALDPVPAARPRVGRYGTYYPKSYARFMKAAEEELYPLSVGQEPTDETVYVSVMCVASKPKSGTLPHPRGDVDNYAKAVLDAITKSQLIWCDDKQVKFLSVEKRYCLGAEEPHVAIRAGLTMGVVWLMENHLEEERQSLDIFDRLERGEFPDDDGEIQS